jgi:ABC-type Na+ efflux pump permease subunit
VTDLLGIITESHVANDPARGYSSPNEHTARQSDKQKTQFKKTRFKPPSFGALFPLQGFAPFFLFLLSRMLVAQIDYI